MNGTKKLAFNSKANFFQIPIFVWLTEIYNK